MQTPSAMTIHFKNGKQLTISYDSFLTLWEKRNREEIIAIPNKNGDIWCCINITEISFIAPESPSPTNVDA